MSFSFPRRGRSLSNGQKSQLEIINLAGDRRVVFSADEVIEAPNWSADGKWLVFNAGGQLFKISLQGGTPKRIDTAQLNDLNNDHVLSPDVTTFYVSSDDGHIYAGAFEGGSVRRVSNEHSTPHHYYLHGISPDGLTLSYVAVEKPDGEAMVNVFTIPSAGGPDTRLTRLLVPSDGPEYSPDGQWIYFNSEMTASHPGHAQVFRMHTDGSDVEQLTFDERVNWFPHCSPDGKNIVYLSYPKGTTGHPADKEVILRLMSPTGDDQRDLATIFGGQGTINVNSWAPSSTQLAFVSYPLG